MVQDGDVQPHLRRRVEVEVSSDLAPVTYDFSIYRVKNATLPGPLGERLFQQAIQASSGVHLFVWEGVQSARRP